MKTFSEQPILDFPALLLVKIVWLVGLVVACVGIASTSGDLKLTGHAILGGGIVFIIALLIWIPAEMKRINQAEQSIQE